MQMRLELKSLYAHWARHAQVLGHSKRWPVSINVGPGEWVAVVGENGVGKSTLLHAIAGAVPFVTGRCAVNGCDLPPRAMFARFASGVAYVPQQPLLQGGASVEEIVAVAVHARPGMYNEDAIADLVEKRLGLAATQRLDGRHIDVLCALVSVPQILLLDEAAIVLQTFGRGLNYADLRALLPRTTVLVVDHDLKAVVAHADRVLWLVPDARALDFPKTDTFAVEKLYAAFPGDRPMTEVVDPKVTKLWQIMHLAESPRQQTQIALRAGARERLADELLSDFPFLTRADPAEGLSGGQRTILLWVLLECSGIGHVPDVLTVHLDANLRAKLLRWRERIPLWTH